MSVRTTIAHHHRCRLLEHMLTSAMMRQRKLFGALMAACLWLTPAPAWPQEVAGTIASASGAVSVTQGGRVQRAQAGMKLLAGDRIATGPGGHTEIKLRDDTLLAMGPDSRMRISRFRFDPKTNAGSMLLTVIKGALRVTTGLIGQRSPDAVQIRTMVGTIGISGAQFIVESGESN